MIIKKRIFFGLIAFLFVLSCKNSKKINNTEKVISKISQKRDSTIKDFIPKGWKVVAITSLDLNGDEKLDYVIVTKSGKAIDRSSDTSYYGNQFFHEKKLLILFQKGKNNFEKKIETSTIFGMNNWGIDHGDAFYRLYKENNTFSIEFVTGGREHSFYKYSFQFLNKTFKLIAIDGFFENFNSLNLIKGIKSQFQSDYNLENGINDLYYNENQSEMDKIVKTSVTVKPLYDLKNFSAEKNEFYQRF